MNRKAVALPLTIVGLLLGSTIALLSRPAPQTSLVTSQVTPVEAEHPLPRERPPNTAESKARNAASHPRTWRPDPADASRNSVRTGYAWILRQMGMSEADLDRIASGDFAGLIKELIKKSDQGDIRAIRSLGWIAQRCAVLRSEDMLNSYQQRLLQEARVLPSADAAWFATFLSQDIDTDRQRIADCSVIDQDHVELLLTGLSQQGDGASTLMLSQESNNMADKNRLAREAAFDGFPEAQYEWAIALLGNADVWHAEHGDPSAMDFLRSAANALASARAELAICEYRGCSGETPDPQQAALDARLAAEQGEPSALVNIASTAPPSLISPVEAQAWALFEVALQQRGCNVSIINVNWMKSMAAATARATPDAQALADQDWQLYGASAMQYLGC